MTYSSSTIACHTLEPKEPANAAVIWLHGLGAGSHDFDAIIPQLQINPKDQVRFIFPQAPVRPVTINQGYVMPAWYDIFGLDRNSNQDEAGVKQSAVQIDALVTEQINHRIPADRIILVGFSQGGAMALYSGLQYPIPLGGIIAMSSYLPIAHTLLPERVAHIKQTPILMMHGQYDEVVSLEFGEQSYAHIKTLGLSCEFKIYPMAHEICLAQIQDLSQVLNQLLAIPAKVS